MKSTMTMRTSLLWLTAVGAGIVPVAAQPSTPTGATRLTAVAVSAQNQGTVVTLSASGPLAPGELQLVPGPPMRLYVDFAGVTPAVPAATPGSGPVSRVRVAINNVTPLVSRVVFDLRERVAYRLDTSERERGTVRLLLGDAAAGGGAAPAVAGTAVARAAEAPAAGAVGEKPVSAGSPVAAATAEEGAGRRLLSPGARVALALERSVETRLPKPLPLVGGDPATAKPVQGRRRASGSEERQQRARAALAEARSLFGQARYEAAAEATGRARDAVPDDGAASTVFGRAMLERYRETADVTFLAQALDALRAVDGVTLAKNDQVDLILGLALGLYLSGEFRPAGDVFATSFEMAEAADPALRDRAVDWWATAMSRHAQSLPAPERMKAFEQMLAAMTEEAKHDPSSASAGYWAVVATRGLGDLDRAWDAAIAHWVRAQLCRDGGDALREDLDKLMATTIIPERAKRGAAALNSSDHAPIEALLFAEWRGVKDKWSER
jgi:hypothetical protein